MKHEHQHQHPHLEQDEIRCSCDQDHDHSKRQYAHPDEPCSCSHDHHEHQNHHSHQEESYICGHDHDKHEIHEHLRPKTNLGDLSITHHENAIIISAEREISGEYLPIKEAIAVGLNGLADWVESQNGLVGHIKTHLTEKGKSAILSTTGDGVQVNEVYHPKVILNLAVIVFAVDEADLANQVLTILNKLY